GRSATRTTNGTGGAERLWVAGVGLWRPRRSAPGSRRLDPGHPDAYGAAMSGTDRMRQAVIAAPDRFTVQVAPRPSGPLVLRTAACGICSGDLMPWYLAKKVGTVFGHEPVGRAVHVEGLDHVREGDLVFVHHHAPCLKCAFCARREYVHCPTWKRTKLEP